MRMLYKNHSCLSEVLKHKKLPIYRTYEFDFYRCVNVDNWVYGKTISELHAGNLRTNNNKGRYSKLFPDEKISYWADSKSTALSEIKKHNGNKNYLTFWAYDDASSTFPILDNDKKLTIINGIDLNFHKILLKIDNDKELTAEENELIKLIRYEGPDCLAYKSVVNKDGINFLFFEKGFKKLSLREVRLYYGERKSKNTNIIQCAFSSDYQPIIDNYGMFFEPIVKERMNENYKNTDEYKIYNINYANSLRRMCQTD